MTVAALLAATAATASAHAILLRSTPSPGAELSAPPATIRATFSESLNRSLSSLRLLEGSGAVVPTRERLIGNVTLELLPRGRLPRGIYEVRWHSVSNVDGHELDGSYYFGVGASAPAGASSSLSDPLSGGGWVRVLLRALFDAGLLFLAGALLCAALLARGAASPARWLLPRAGSPEGTSGRSPAPRPARLWRRVLIVGLLGLIAGVASTLADAANAGGGLSGSTLHAFLLANTTGVARLVTLVALALALLLAWRRASVAGSVLALVALVALSVGGHSNSAHPRALAIVSDSAHLAAAGVWLGGLTLIAWTWLPRLRALEEAQRRRLMAEVLGGFGRVALPAFGVVLLAGVVNAAVELGSLSALWSTSYGRVLLVKGGLVGLIPLASYLHAMRLRPRILTRERDAEGLAALERRHWRLLGLEPLAAAAVVVAGALLIAYNAPGEGASGAAAPSRALRPPAGTRPLHLSVAPRQLTVAAEAGPYIVGVWVEHAAGARLRVEIHTLTLYTVPRTVPVSIEPGTLGPRCGTGCVLASVPAAARTLAVTVRTRSGSPTARLPIAYDPAGAALARRLVTEVGDAQDRLRSARLHESLAGGPTTPDITEYEIEAPDRFAYQLSHGGRPVSDTIIVGRREWNRSAGQRAWQASSYGTQPWSALSYLSWWGDYAQSPRLLDLRSAGATRYADVATLSYVGGLGPVWLRMHLDVTHRRLLTLRMITVAHFMVQHWSDFNVPQRIEPPAAAAAGG